MQEYNITVFRQSRILLSLFLAPIIFLVSIFIGAETNSFVFLILFLLISLYLIYYFIVGNLKITIKNEDELFFEWKKKIVFNYKTIKPIKISKIKTIVLDEEKLLRKIKTDDVTIYINNSKINYKQTDEFIDRLKHEIKKYDIRVIDSWDEFSEKGYLKTAYIISSSVLVISIVLAIIFTIIKGFKPALLSILLLFIPQIILYKKQIGNKINNLN
jgi:hypothetical protein